MVERATIVDVSERDGFQDEPKFVATDEKLAVASALAAAGIREIEVTSFVHPRYVPQLADADALVPRLPKTARYSALVLNQRGIERALAAFDAGGFRRGDYDLVAVISASPKHNAANNNRTIPQSLAIFDEMAAAARSAGVTLRAALSCAFVSPWPDERIDPATVAEIAMRFAAGGCSVVTLADTVGRADPRTVARRVDEIAAAIDVPLALHLHDSSGFALANVYAGLERGVDRFESALAGLGGCPFAPGAPGNLDTEKLARFLAACGVATGLDLDALAAAKERIVRALAA
jgi:hydroxymethylglutaryl-CoA lyase